MQIFSATLTEMKIKTSISIDQEVLKRLDIVAGKTGRSRSAILDMVIHALVTEYLANADRMTLEAVIEECMARIEKTLATQTKETGKSFLRRRAQREKGNRGSQEPLDKPREDRASQGE